MQVLKRMGEFLEETFGTSNKGHAYVDEFQLAKISEEGFGQVYLNLRPYTNYASRKRFW
jgi:hypothetical protein